MKKEEFIKLNIEEQVKYLNEKLSEGHTVIRIREDIAIGEKALQKLIKQGGYKYNPKARKYIKTTIPDVVVEETTTVITNVVDKNTNVVQSIGNSNIKYLSDNFTILKELIENYKRATTNATTQSTTGIVVDLVDDKHLNPKPKSLRINEFVWEDWQKFCEENKYYSKQDLVSMALKTYINLYKKRND